MPLASLAILRQGRFSQAWTKVSLWPLATMSEEAENFNEDPLVAALPPATDYLTYLTLLEYQLKAKNLGTLNRLLSEDSGTLAEEIGWDLLRLVLPMLEKAPQVADDCLDIIARRGNPREVVVRLAEELEKLGHQPSGEEDESRLDAADEVDDDGSPTFAEEAKRIHLGDMKLEGMPESEEVNPESLDQQEELENGPPPVNTTQQDQLIFMALLSMLCTVHPRIRTQHPSRFLATSLPAALGAYRRMPTSLAATKSFLTCLRKLSGRQSPPLPPRASTGNVLGTVADSVNKDAPVSLPDPEASAEVADGRTLPSDNEKAIMTRLLQAVLLEIVDEYMAALQIQETPSMAWTRRLREKLEQGRIIPGKQTETELWETDEDLKQRDELMITFISLAKDLRLEVLPELRKVLSANTTDAAPKETDVDDEHVSEYPKSPADIPFTPTALLLLGTGHEHMSASRVPTLGLELMPRAFNLITPLAQSPSLPSPAVQDALHALLYASLGFASRNRTENQDTLSTLVRTLTQTFTTNPYPQLRDDAHHIATRILHSHCYPSTRLAVIKQSLDGFTVITASDGSTEMIPLSTPFTAAILRATAVDWLKDEFSRHARYSSEDDQPLKGEMKLGIEPTVLDEDTELCDRIFVQIPSVPSATASESDVQNQVLSLLPFYTAVLNFSCVVLSNSILTSQTSLKDKAKAIHSALHPWLEYLPERTSSVEDIEQSLPEIWALEDAHLRLGAVLGK